MSMKSKNGKTTITLTFDESCPKDREILDNVINIENYLKLVKKEFKTIDCDLAQVIKSMVLDCKESQVEGIVKSTLSNKDWCSILSNTYNTKEGKNVSEFDFMMDIYRDLGLREINILKDEAFLSFKNNVLEKSIQ